MPALVRRFYLLTFEVSWLAWGAAWALGDAPAAMGLVLLGAFGPSAAALVLATREPEGPGLRALIRRTIEPGRIPGRVWLVVVLLFPLMLLAARAIDAALGGAPAPLDASVLASPAGAAGFVLLILLAGPVSEEIGWRGWVLDPLQRARGPLRASLGLGVIWVAWHLPLFLIPGTSQYPIGLGTLPFWLWSAQVLCLSLIFTAVYNRTRFSVMSAILLHFFANFTYSLFVPIGEAAALQTEVVSTVVHAAAACAALCIGLGTPRHDGDAS